MPNRQRKGFSLIELLIVIAIILIIVTVALPKLNKARMYAQETAALKAIQTLNTAQVQYNSQFGRFAQSLTELGPPASGTDNASAANLISGDMAAGEPALRLTEPPRCGGIGDMDIVDDEHERLAFSLAA